MQEEHIALFYKEGASDKEYHIHLVQQGSGWVVNFEYGRRGAALRSGTKTKEPIEYALAKKTYDKVLHGQLKDGYTQSESGSLYQAPKFEDRFTGILPQLLNSVGVDDLESLYTNTSFVAQEKFDGERRMTQKKKDKTVEGMNRDGLLVPLPNPLVAALLALPQKQVLFDAEILGEQLAIFDVLEVDGVSLREKPFEERFTMLEAILLKNPSESFILAPVAKTEKEKRALFERIKTENGEGLVFKEKSAPYTPGRPASGGNQRKFKFIESATVKVIEAHKTKRSVFIAVKDENQKEIPVGKVSIPVNYDVPNVGDIVEVKYLYAYPNGSLFQPVYKGVRTDQSESACVQSQLKYKKGTEDKPKPSM
jgi:bifunctional non-homologous end joining protein LigD